MKIIKNKKFAVISTLVLLLGVQSIAFSIEPRLENNPGLLAKMVETFSILAKKGVFSSEDRKTLDNLSQASENLTHNGIKIQVTPNIPSFVNVIKMAGIGIIGVGLTGLGLKLIYKKYNRPKNTSVWASTWSGTLKQVVWNQYSAGTVTALTGLILLLNCEKFV